MTSEGGALVGAETPKADPVGLIYGVQVPAGAHDELYLFNGTRFQPNNHPFRCSCHIGRLPRMIYASEARTAELRPWRGGLR